MTTIFDGTTKYPGMEGVTIAMSPEQARRLAEAIKDAAAEAEGGAA